MRERLESALRVLRGQMSRPPPPPPEKEEEDQASMRALTGDPMQVFRFGTLDNNILSMLYFYPFYPNFEDSSAALAGQANWQRSYKDWKVLTFFSTLLNWRKKNSFFFEQMSMTLWERKSCRPLRMSMLTWAETLETSMALQWRWQGCRSEKKTIFVFKINLFIFLKMPSILIGLTPSPWLMKGDCPRRSLKNQMETHQGLI